ncbi:MAG: PAS domain S-box protein, partial [Phycisphaerales bacterium]
MQDHNKSKADLTEELESLRSRIVELQKARCDFRNEKAEAIPRTGELRFQLDSLPVMAYALDSQRGVTLWNAECERTTGYSADEIIGNPDSLRLLYPEQAYRKRIVREWVSEDGWRTKEHTITCKDGSTRVVRFSNLSALFSIRDAAVWAVGTDITDFCREEDSLRQSVCEYRDLMEEMTDLVYTIDTEGRMTSVNKAVKTLFGLEPEDVIGRKFDNWIPQEELQNAVSVFKRVLDGAKITAETVVVMPDGSRYNVELSSTPIIRDGATVGVRGIIRDITGRKKRDKELKESEERFKAIFENLADAVLLVDGETREFYMANKAFCRALGYRPEEVRNLTIADIHPEEHLPYVQEQLARQMSGEVPLGKDVPVKRKNGSIFYADIRSFPITLAGKTYLMGVARDVTER